MGKNIIFCLDVICEWPVENVLAWKCDTAQSEVAGGQIFADMAPGEDLNLPEENKENKQNDEALVIMS